MARYTLKAKPEKRERDINKVVIYLGRFGNVIFHDYEFSNSIVQSLASIEITTDVTIAIGLEGKINEEMHTNGNGNIPADIRFISPVGNPVKGKFKYSAEIVPRQNSELSAGYIIPENSTKNNERIKYATNLFLKELPRVLKNLRQKKVCLVQELE